MRKPLTILSGILVGCILLASCFIERVPPRSITSARMQVLKRRMLQYAQIYGEFPKSLARLSLMQGYDCSILDGWKRDILFEVSDSGLVTFRSLGRNAAVGGSGQDADIIRSFPARDAQGRWSEETVEWTGENSKGENGCCALPVL